MFLFGRKKRKDALEALMDSITDETQNELEAYEKKHIPAGCRACGGDYPSCKASCPMYDD